MTVGLIAQKRGTLRKIHGRLLHVIIGTNQANTALAACTQGVSVSGRLPLNVE